MKALKFFSFNTFTRSVVTEYSTEAKSRRKVYINSQLGSKSATATRWRKCLMLGLLDKSVDV